jgi:TM2 domain-containing membrane protein YozV
MSQYFVRRAGRVDGPWTFERLQSEVKLRKLSKFHEISSDGATWQRAENLSDLFETLMVSKRFQQPAPPPEEVAPEVVASNETTVPSPLDQPSVWYIEMQGSPAGPYSSSEIRDAWVGGRLESELAWRDGLANWLSLKEIPEFSYWYHQRQSEQASASFSTAEPPWAGQTAKASYQNPYLAQSEIQNFAGKKITAGLCGIFFGGLGVHKFVLGLNNAGIIMLMIWLVGLTTGMCIIVPIFGSLAMNLIGFIEGIIYLTKSDEDFYQTYAVRKKEWF